MTSQDFHDSRSRFSSWQVETSMTTGRDFIMNGRDFHDDV